ncbi:class A rhodopsin-like G-protein coupled receptor GPRnpy1, putative [Pediculus humanus corporis]|uniref:Class A rhodopsin-like G-protein coupled receptor GPRnpy1, putative n=1 Tax=Pediculus humanus subsp. corporis TaxID=121224 RepID=E0VA32_PEDHC|nr:class A rhodopsin-like G-protein coupled receptor GPRnpy1, putative [Pediculus humanus corporis]EEB10238.1 class A rhodopsin-like G-protein coupled receptor GPRnpy1, putative [Pediculus humanus corporis]
MDDESIQHNVAFQGFNTTRLLEESKNINPNILKLYQLNRKVDGLAFYSLIVAYTFLILVGTFGNFLVVYVIITKPAMRTVRNLFILNLAISDLLLCLITMPLTLMEILTRYWPLGHNGFICKMIGTFEAISIFVSTFSITAIALDRYQVIVYPMRDSLHHLGALIALGGIWLLSGVLASPMYFCRKLDILQDVNFTQIGLDGLAYCLEDWTIPHGRALYSIFVLIIQYVVPIVIVSVAYSRICKKLQYRYVRKSREDRRRKTNSLFIAIALVYCISWLPLNLCNVVYDAANPFGEDFHTTIVVFAVCHMMGMSSACSNPFLYGWLNDNFRKEFKGECFSFFFSYHISRRVVRIIIFSKLLLLLF